MVSTNLIPISDSFVSLTTLYFSSNRFFKIVCMNYFCTPLLKVKTENTQQENHLYIIREIYTVFEFKYFNWIKTRASIKLFHKSPLGTIQILTDS